MHLHLFFRWSFTHKHDEVCGSVLTFARALRPPAASCSMVGRAQEIPNCYAQYAANYRPGASLHSCWLRTLSYLQCPDICKQRAIVVNAGSEWTALCMCTRLCHGFYGSPSFDGFITECSKCSYSYNGIQLLPKRELPEDLFTNLITILSYTDIKWSYIALQQTKRFQHCDLIGNFKQTMVYTLLSF